jgi:hypothetical protein
MSDIPGKLKYPVTNFTKKTSKTGLPFNLHLCKGQRNLYRAFRALNHVVLTAKIPLFDILFFQFPFFLIFVFQSLPNKVSHL